MEQQVLELKAKCEAIEKRESERRAMEERKHAEEIAFLKKTNVQLKVMILYSYCYLSNTHHHHSPQTHHHHLDSIGRHLVSTKEIKSYCIFSMILDDIAILNTCLNLDLTKE